MYVNMYICKQVCHKRELWSWSGCCEGDEFEHYGKRRSAAYLDKSSSIFSVQIGDQEALPSWDF